MAHSAESYQCIVTMHFCPHVAAAIGVGEAIVVHRLDYWLSRSKHCFEGRAWIYNTCYG